MPPRPSTYPVHRAKALRLIAAWAVGLAGLTGPLQAATPSAAPLATPSATPATCDLLWQVTLQPESEPRQLQVDLTFDAGSRSRSTLRLPGGWESMSELADTEKRLQAVAGDNTLRSIAHAPGERVQLRWRFVPSAASAQSSGAQLASSWFAVAGQSLLPWPEEVDERNPPSACIGFSAQPSAPGQANATAGPATRWVNSHGNAEGLSALFRVAPGAATLRWRVQQALYAGGAMQSLTRIDDGQPMIVARPVAPAWAQGIEAVAQASAQSQASQRRFWGDNTPASTLLVLQLPSLSGTQATHWHQAVALQVPIDLRLPGADFDALITGALVRTWIPDRFGPLTYPGRQDESMRAWFSQGLADHYAHRLLLRDGRWTPDDYANAINRKIDGYLSASDPTGTARRQASETQRSEASAILDATRGEWLALQWHGALRASGQAGLDAVMRRLLLPAAQARREGPISAPLATHRLFAALRPALGELPLRDINRQIEQGEFPVFGPTTIGPCFTGQKVSTPGWRLGFDPASLVSGVVSGVEAGGPAELAGLRDGMTLARPSTVPVDASQAVRLKVEEPDGTLRELRYLPAGKPLGERMHYQPVPQAMQLPACLAWLGLGAEVLPAATRPVPKPAPAAVTPKTVAKPAAKPTGKPLPKSGPKPVPITKPVVKPNPKPPPSGVKPVVRP